MKQREELAVIVVESIGLLPVGSVSWSSSTLISAPAHLLFHVERVSTLSGWRHGNEEWVSMLSSPGLTCLQLGVVSMDASCSL